VKIAILAQIREILPLLDLIPAIEEGFVAYSLDRATVPPVGELILDKGEVHIKSGFIAGEDLYVI
jgi:ornithine cyclodeaminase